jgi:putative ABC transport system ATP-binding protein
LGDDQEVTSSTDSSPIIRVESLGRAYRTGVEKIVAIHDVSFTVARGEAVAITGPSGSGKTTLLNLIAALDRPTAGRVVVADNDLSLMNETELTRFRATVVGIVFQDPHLLPGLTTLENVIVGRLPWGSWSKLRPTAERLLERVGLGQRLSHPPAKLSGGERQRVAIARALLGYPQILVADEPTGNLDARTTEQLLKLIRDLRDELNLTVVVATHDPFVSASADRVINLRPVTDSIHGQTRVPETPTSC